ncbi:putative oxidoreductase YhhX [Lacunisphaera limnophila]|uniref:Putative oxidoreductase YhhX n=1 Tax=Lacunisphaera limnophila TaxID=1838286 RepID=A0A1D8AWD5_9BACT|nr:Gfo/Idh/MocA family oxidoreductase [Lacunisphaera limnophila]AOS45175.1 putative oxidoreductase YhhX [Lacunisphaera limnophila]
MSDQPRRHFLKTLAVGAATVAVSASAQTPAPMTQKADGMNYAPKGKPNPVVKPGEFVFAAAHLDHGHINGQCNGLIEAGGTLKWVHEPDPKKLEAFLKAYPGTQVAASLDEILADPEVKLVATAAIPKFRGPIGCKVMQAGKDYFTDKPPFTTLAQLDEAKKVAAATGKKFMVYYSERLHVESAMFATDLVQQGAIGRVLQVIGLGPHREGTGRPDWFYDRESYGGILCDIGSHQFEQFLTYTGATDATIQHAAVANYAHPDQPGLDDFGEANLLGNNGATNYVRVDWFTPKGLSTWGDGRTIILGEKGYIELRKYVDVGRDRKGDNVYIVDQEGERYINVDGQVGFRFFGELILDCINRTEKAMTQAHAFKAAELCLKAQAAAKKIG